MILKVLQRNLFSLLLVAILCIIIYLVSQLVPEEIIRTIIIKSGPFGPLVLILGILFLWLAVWVILKKRFWTCLPAGRARPE